MNKSDSRSLTISAQDRDLSCEAGWERARSAAAARCAAPMPGMQTRPSASQRAGRGRLQLAIGADETRGLHSLRRVRRVGRRELAVSPTSVARSIRGEADQRRCRSVCRAGAGRRVADAGCGECGARLNEAVRLSARGSKRHARRCDAAGRFVRARSLVLRVRGECSLRSASSQRSARASCGTAEAGGLRFRAGWAPLSQPASLSLSLSVSLSCSLEAIRVDSSSLGRPQSASHAGLTRVARLALGRFGRHAHVRLHHAHTQRHIRTLALPTHASCGARVRRGQLPHAMSSHATDTNAHA